MHQLDRSRSPAPTCLSQYKHGQNTWGDLTGDDREEIRAALEVVQERRCAYCECSLDQHDQHIEHFRQRHLYPQGTFDWNNLFWSCNQRESCGHHKDSCGSFNHTDLIKPDADDPEHFFVFVSNGSIVVRRTNNLSQTEQYRAAETLRILNLDARWGRLRQMRRAAVVGYLDTVIELQELSAICSPQDIAVYMADELAMTQGLPFCTAIKHVLTSQ